MKSRSRASAPSTVKRTVPPGRLPNAQYRTREYLTEREVERLMKAASKRTGASQQRAATCRGGSRGKGNTTPTRHRQRPSRRATARHTTAVSTTKQRLLSSVARIGVRSVDDIAPASQPRTCSHFAANWRAIRMASTCDFPNACAAALQASMHNPQTRTPPEREKGGAPGTPMANCIEFDFSAGWRFFVL